jgi:hypothetical protein
MPTKVSIYQNGSKNYCVTTVVFALCTFYTEATKRLEIYLKLADILHYQVVDQRSRKNIVLLGQGHLDNLQFDM